MAAANAIFAFLRRAGHDPAATAAFAAWENGTLVEAPADPTALAPTPAPALIARQQGYTGDQCSICSSLRMKRNGSCAVCEECGTTTGCS